MANNNFFVAMLTILLILAVAYYILGQGGSERSSSEGDKIQDGNTLKFSCRGKVTTNISKATYGPTSSTTNCDTVNVTSFMQQWVKKNPGKIFQVSPSSFPNVNIPSCNGNRTLTINYACV